MGAPIIHRRRKHLSALVKYDPKFAGFQKAVRTRVTLIHWTTIKAAKNIMKNGFDPAYLKGGGQGWGLYLAEHQQDLDFGPISFTSSKFGGSECMLTASFKVGWVLDLTKPNTLYQKAMVHALKTGQFRELLHQGKFFIDEYCKIHGYDSLVYLGGGDNTAVWCVLKNPAYIKGAENIKIQLLKGKHGLWPKTGGAVWLTSDYSGIAKVDTYTLRPRTWQQKVPKVLQFLFPPSVRNRIRTLVEKFKRKDFS